MLPSFLFFSKEKTGIFFFRLAIYLTGGIVVQFLRFSNIFYLVFLPTGPYQKHFVPITLAEWCQLHKDSCRAQKYRGLLEGIGAISERREGGE